MKALKFVLLGVSTIFAILLIFNRSFFFNEYHLGIWNKEILIFRLIAAAIGLILINTALRNIKE